MIQITNVIQENSFNNPLGLLSDCHRRIERFLDQILRVCEAREGGALAEGEREALSVALRYFRRAAPLHTADEESSLFPRLRRQAQSGGEAARGAVSVIERLEADHDAADARHALIDELGTRWLGQGTLPAADAMCLGNEARELRAFYAAHITVEDESLFPLAGETLDSEAVEAIGREMAERRGLDYDEQLRMKHALDGARRPGCSGRGRTEPKPQS
jgi:hemerythrin-like domain-containing protein